MIYDIFDTSEPYTKDTAWAESIAFRITEKLDSLGQRCELIENGISIGPQVIKFSYEISEGQLVRNLPKLAQEIKYELGVLSCRILAPEPGKRAVGIEIENPERQLVQLGDLLGDFQGAAPLEFPLGISPDGELIRADIRTMPHCLIGGTTGSGKSTALHSMIVSLLARNSPEVLKLLLIDTKMVELIQYEETPHIINSVITDPFDAAAAFTWLVKVMNSRYEHASALRVRSLEEWNDKIDTKYPYIVVIVDEMADLIMAAKKSIEDSVIKIAQKARAVGIHLIFATQTPRKDVCTGLLKANLPSRISFSTASELDSRIILDTNGAGSLLGNGDMLFSLEGRIAQRVQSPYISIKEIERLVDHLSQKELVTA